jgi:hypothetical protein
MALGGVAATVASDETTKRGDGGADTSDAGFDVGAEHGVGNPDWFGESVKRIREVIMGPNAYMIDPAFG